MIVLEHVTKQFMDGPRSVTALNNISFEVNKGEIYGVIGHSGAGKSTLIRTINLLERPTSGRVLIDQVELTSLNSRRLQEERRNIGMIFQHFNLLSSATVRDNIAFPLRLVRNQTSQINRRVDELLQLVGLTEHGNKYPAQLSGGQKQRVGIARALATNPKVLLCDEATSALDPQTTQSILSLLLDINRKLGITIVLITHEMQVIRSVCDRVAVLDRGQIIETGKVADVFLKPQQPATKLMLTEASETNHLQLASAGHSGNTLLRITFVGQQTYEPVLYEMMRESGIPLVILSGTISQMKDVPYGQLVVELQGKGQEAETVIHGLRRRGLDVEVIGL